MLFNSLGFLIFFPFISVLYYLMPHKFRWLLLLGASYYFYMSWRPEYIILILLSTCVDYVVAIGIANNTSKSKKNIYLFISLIMNLGLLFIFKYYNFFSGSVSMIFGFEPRYLDILLPVGISFYTFQTLSYTIDVYRGKKEPETHFGIFALFVSFFPQLVAGPIERSGTLIGQLKSKVEFNYEQVTYGVKRMVWGFFKKVVIADRMAVMVDYVYNQPGEFSGTALFMATLFFAIQIYCDFSAYSDIAIGAAQVLGIRLMENFRMPYLSTSIQEFWRRWHISLSIWFRDYVFFPLGGSRVKRLRHLINVCIVFILSGLWHGASWTFVIWGALHALFNCMEILIKPLRVKLEENLKINWLKSIYNLFTMAVTFFLVNIAWVFFRANNVTDAWLIFKKFVTDLHFYPREIIQVISQMGLSQREFIIAVLAMIVLMVVDVLESKQNVIQKLSEKRPYYRWVIYYMITTATIWLAYTGSSQFVYFQF
jgi:D-alanyl-lipoteichoic acid acyltransferase DltB (MBOAT superfamily)